MARERPPMVQFDKSKEPSYLEKQIILEIKKQEQQQKTIKVKA